MTPAPPSLGRRASATARAETDRLPARGSLTSLLRLGAFFLISCSSAAGAANIGATVSIYSDARFRGYSLTNGSPAAILDFAYDDSSGVYGGASAIAQLRHFGDPGAAGLELDAGYAKRLASGTTIDVGITHSAYSHYSIHDGGVSYTEIYAGISRGRLSSRLFLSPHYFATGLWTAYGEIDGNVSPARKWTLDGHIGLLLPLRTPNIDQGYRANFDWRVGLTRELGRLSLHAAWSDGVPPGDYYHDRQHGRSAFVVGASLVL